MPSSARRGTGAKVKASVGERRIRERAVLDICALHPCVPRFGIFLTIQAGIQGSRGRYPGTKKPAQVAGFSVAESLVETFRYCYMVPRGRLELPLLSKTDFESAASTNSAIRAQWRRSIEMRLPLVNHVSWSIFTISARLPGPARRTPSCALLTLLLNSRIR